MKSFLPAAFMAASTLLTLPARAHHGQEFFLLYDAQVQEPLHGILQGQFSFLDEGTDDSLGLSPSLSLGVLPRTAFNLRADFTEEAGESWAYRSIEPGFQFDLTPPRLKLPLRFGLAVSYQFSEDRGHSGGGHSRAATDLSGGTVAHVHDNSSASSLSHSHAGTVEAAHDHSSHYHPPPPVSVPGPGTGGVPDQGPDGLTPEELAAMEAENAAAAAAQQQAAASAAAAARKAKSGKKAPSPKAAGQKIPPTATRRNRAIPTPAAFTITRTICSPPG